MKIVLFGATGGTGSKLVERALAAGHDVVAVARRPDAITTKHPKLRVVTGDVLKPETLDAPIAGADAIISTIGPPNNKQPGTLISEGIANLVTAASRAGVRRFVFESGLIMSDGHELSPIGRIGVSIFRALNRKLYEEKLLAEASLRASVLDWVIVRPPSLVHQPGTGKYIAGADARINPAKALSHEDAADFLVKAATEPKWVRLTINVGH